MSEEYDKMMPDEAGEKGGDILSHLMKIYNLVEWGNEPAEFVRVTLYKDKTMEIINHMDVKQGLQPSKFRLSDDNEWEEVD